MTQIDKDTALAALDIQISELQTQRAALEAEPVEIITPPFAPSMPVPVGTRTDGIITVSETGDATSFEVQLHRPAPDAAITTSAPIGSGVSVADHAPDAIAFQVRGKYWSPDGTPEAESEWSEVVTIQ